MIFHRLTLLILLPGIAAAQITDLRLPISLDAISTDYDGKNSMLTFRGLRLTQGNIGIEADIGRASKLDFQDSVWHFSGNVIIDVENGHIECASADLQFKDNQLKFATIKGAPATFEMKRPGSDEVTFAQAGTLRYDLDAGVIEFSEEATFTEGGNQISSSILVYNIKEQRIKAQSSGDGDGRVKITYTPPDAATPGEDEAVGEEEPDTDQTVDAEKPDSDQTIDAEKPQTGERNL
jgi:lipopolysaccharide transport protein LptA